ncbi:MAG TPA: helix-turn-helix domain-containing protein [Streptosporangiaceae bacterium]|nr:helix-turn-helix domain-containing protein [Streptosporangiaceae bacterium]
MTSHQAADRLLTVEAAAERMSTSPRFVRRLIAERRIEFVKIGRHVRISESALTEFLEAGKELPDGEQGRSPTLRKHPQAAVRPVSDPLPRA